MSPQLPGGSGSNPRQASVAPSQTWWLELGIEVIRACLVAASSVLVKELIQRVGQRSAQTYDHNGDGDEEV